MRRFLIPIVPLLVLAACSRTPVLKLTRVGSMDKVLYCDSVFCDHSDTLLVARGENAVFQFVVAASADISSLQAEVSACGLGEIRTGWVHDVFNSSAAAGASDLISTPENLYPDPVIDDMEESLAKGGHRAVVTDIAIPRDARPGIYKCTVKVCGETVKGRSCARKSFNIKVYPVTLPQEQRLKVVNWYTTASLHFLDGGEPVDVPSDRYRDLLSILARAGADYGQNCWLIREDPLVKLNADSTDFVLDFTEFDKTVEMLMREGNLKYLCLPHFGDHAPGVPWTEAMMFNIITVEDGRIVKDFVKHTDPRLAPFIRKYFTQWEKHMVEKGWLDFCYQHIADEPDWKGTESQKSWSYVASLVKEAAPSLRIIDASYEVVENQDVSVVVLGENIASLPPLPEGCERWMYTCCIPQGNFANRYVQQPLVKTRLLHWINYRYNECGYLHWGLNYWHYSNSGDPLHDVTPMYGWPGGDCFVVYPGNHKVYPSIRLLAMRDGINDYELLSMAADIDPIRARAWSETMVMGADEYVTDVEKLYSVRREILDFLSDVQ